MNADSEEMMAVVCMLALYLRNNPLACDTLEGIARWWFGPDSLVRETVLALALQWMSARGLVEAIPTSDGKLRFRKAHNGTRVDAELDRLIKGPPPGDPLIVH